jgi:hypothetical protein
MIFKLSVPEAVKARRPADSVGAPSRFQPVSRAGRNGDSALAWMDALTCRSRGGPPASMRVLEKSRRQNSRDRAQTVTVTVTTYGRMLPLTVARSGRRACRLGTGVSDHDFATVTVP